MFFFFSIRLFGAAFGAAFAAAGAARGMALFAALRDELLVWASLSASSTCETCAARKTKTRLAEFSHGPSQHAKAEFRLKRCTHGALFPLTECAHQEIRTQGQWPKMQLRAAPTSSLVPNDPDCSEKSGRDARH